MGPGKRKDAVTRLVFDALSRLMQGNDRADLIINNLFRVNKVTDDAVRRETVKIFYGLIRFWRPITSAVRLGEVLFPADAERLIEAFEVWMELYNGRPVKADPTLSDKLNKYLRIRKIRESITDWMDETGVKQLGESTWEGIVHFMNTDPVVFIHVNTARVSVNELYDQLQTEDISAEILDDVPGAIQLKEYRNVFSMQAFQEGLFEVQDRSSQEVGLFCNVRPGQIVIDACAGAGGKTLHMASAMKNSGKIYAMDTVDSKLKTLRERCTRAKVDIVETKHINSPDDLKVFSSKADVLLLDVPCSGTGVLRRNPDAKWRIDEVDLQRLHNLQKSILKDYAAMVKQGGTLVYSTCSVFPSEGEDQAAWFTTTFADQWMLEEEKRVGCDEHLGDGFYMARWKRK